MRPRRSSLLGLAALALLGACSNEAVDTTSNSFILDAGSSLWSRLRQPSQADFTLTRAQLASVDYSVLWVTSQLSGAEGSAIAVGINRDAITWITANAVTLVTKDDLLFGTRGLGADLMTTETAPARRALRARQADSYPRIYRFLSGDESIRKERYFCEMENDGPATREVLDIRHATTQMRETCYALDGGREFQNVYWVGADGVVWDSVQWVGPLSGYLNIQRLVR